jgi:DNA (cytosine-5)-methyltransferase 1
MNALDLFSGIGGISLGLQEYVTTIAYCENDRHAQSVLLSRMHDGSIDKGPIWDDITTLKGSDIPCRIDIIVGGFPCQDLSVAGRGEGLAGKRSGLFYEVCRLVKEIQPSFVFLENVPAIRTRGLREVIREFTDMGYDCRWTCVSAQEVGAPHLRKRWFLLAYSHGFNSRNQWQKEVSENRKMDQWKTESNNYGKSESLANTNPKCDESEQGFKKANKTEHNEFGGISENMADGHSRGFKQCDSGRNRELSAWKVEPDVGRVVDGLSLRMDRIKRLGNAVVPLQAKKAFEKLINI